MISMSAEEDNLYYEREQTQIKHLVLEKYLARFARIVGRWAGGILYIDGFSGPWNTVSDDFKDSSFAIALAQLRAARDTVKEAFQKDLSIQCVFLEKNPSAFERLSAYASEQRDVQVKALNLPFEEAIPELVRIVEADEEKRFPFILIDPKGWKGFSMDTIAPLIRRAPCEVLVNFMTGHILRFIEDERGGVKASFRRLFGDNSFEEKIEGLEGQAREDAIVTAYADRLAFVGGYPYVSTALILNPTKDRTHYHLIYATRDIKGIEVFKDAERQGIKLAESNRAEAKRRERESSSGQLELLGGQVLPEREHLARLQEHFEALAAVMLAAKGNEAPECDYDDLFAAALRFPMVQKKFLDKWLSQRAEFIGLGSSRKPQIRQKHRVRFHSL